jgi:hypothetical protein
LPLAIDDGTENAFHAHGSTDPDGIVGDALLAPEDCL